MWGWFNIMYVVFKVVMVMVLCKLYVGKVCEDGCVEILYFDGYVSLGVDG